MGDHMLIHVLKRWATICLFMLRDGRPYAYSCVKEMGDHMLIHVKEMGDHMPIHVLKRWATICLFMC